MGAGKWSSSQWDRYASQNINNAASVRQIYGRNSLHQDLDPRLITVRESCDSQDNPNSTALIVGLDVTASMDTVLDKVAREGLNKLAEEIYGRKPISDPHIMFAGIGDVAAYSRAPLQVTQFEADIRIAEQLTQIWLEGGGGGNGSESYALLWYFAAYKTKIDCYEKRKQKGLLFTIGDDGPTPFLTADQISQVMGIRPEVDSLSSRDILTAVSRYYDVFHISLEEGFTYSDRVVQQWDDLLGERHLKVADHEKISEVIVSTLQMLRGDDYNTVVNSWDGSTAMVVREALKGLQVTNNNDDGVIKF